MLVGRHPERVALGRQQRTAGGFIDRTTACVIRHATVAGDHVADIALPVELHAQLDHDVLQPEHPGIDRPAFPDLLREAADLALGQGGGAGRAAAAGGGSPTGTAPLTQGEIRGLAEQIGECWSVDAGMLGLQDIVVELRVQLDGQGNVRNVVPGDRGVPNDARSRAVYESARRALLSPQCNPLRVPTDKHRTVMESTFRFNPRGLVPR